MSGKFLRVISLILVLTLLPGCWSRREIEDLAIASGTAIDIIEAPNNKKFRVSVQVARARQLGGGQQGARGGGGKDPGWLVSGFGETIYEAGRNITVRSPRAMVLYHNRVLVIGERAAREGVQEILDFFLRYRETRLRTWIVVTPGEAQNIFKSGPEIEQILAEELTGIVSNISNQSSKSYAVDMRNFATALVEPGQDAVAPKAGVIKVMENIGSDPSVLTGEPQRTVQVQGLAVFRRDRLAGWLNDDETKGFLYMTGKARAGSIIVKLQGEEGKKISFMMTRTKSEIKPRVEKGEVRFSVKIDAEGDLVENESTMDISEPEILERVNREVAGEVSRLARRSLDKAQRRLGADIFGFGEKLHKAEPEYWKQVEEKWYDIYPTVDVSIQVTANIRRTGMVSKPFEIK